MYWHRSEHSTLGKGKFSHLFSECPPGTEDALNADKPFEGYSMSEAKRRVMQSIFALSDEIDYNIYEAVDIAEYACMDENEVRCIISDLYEEGYLGECMTVGDDGFDTFYLNRKGRALIGVE